MINNNTIHYCMPLLSNNDIEYNFMVNILKHLLLTQHKIVVTLIVAMEKYVIYKYYLIPNYFNLYQL